jgi:hypothetical protein
VVEQVATGRRGHVGREVGVVRTRQRRIGWRPERVVLVAEDPARPRQNGANSGKDDWKQWAKPGQGSDAESASPEAWSREVWKDKG